MKCVVQITDIVEEDNGVTAIIQILEHDWNDHEEYIMLEELEDWLCTNIRYQFNFLHNMDLEVEMEVV